MKKIKIIWTLLILLTMISSCRKDSDVTLWDFETKIEVDGFVTGDNGEVLSEVAVTIGSQSTMTDQFGYFKFDEAIGTNEKIYVKAAKGGYFPGSRVEFTRATDKKHVRIKLLPMEFEYTFDASSIATVIADDKVKLTFPAQSVSRANGTIYIGEVKAAVKYIDPTTTEGHTEMPGNLVGKSINGEEQSLESYAMVAVELRGASGEELNVAEGKEVLVEFDIPNLLRSNAPSTIPLWHFEEEEGIWIEEGSALRVGNKYEGKVSHFSFWNCDYPGELVYVKGRVLYNGEPLQVTVQLIMALNTTSRTSRTDKDGIFEGVIPRNEMLNLAVIDDCNNVIYEKVIGSFDKDVVIEDVVLDGNPLASIIRDLNILVVDCSKNPIPNVYLEVDGEIVFKKTDIEGRISYNIGNCSKNSSSIKVIDVVNGLESVVITVLPTRTHELELEICSKPFVLNHFVHFSFSNGDEFIQVNSINDYDYIEVKGINYEGIGIGDGNQVAYGYINHLQPRILNKNIPLSRFQNIIEIGDDRFEYENVNFDDKDFITYAQIATVDNQYTEGKFKLEGVDKYRVENQNLVLVESNLTIEGTFKVQYND